jgi:zinc protease
VVGDFDPNTIRTALASLLGNWQAKVPYIRVPDILTQPAKQQLTLNVPDKANAVYFAELTFPLKDTDPDFVPLLVASRVFGSGADSRIFNRLRQKDGFSYSAGADISASSLDSVANYSAYAIFNPINKDKVIQAFQSEVAHATQNGFTPQEIASAKAALLQEAYLARSADSSLASQLISQLFLKRDYLFTAQREAKIKAVTPEQASLAFRKYIKPTHLTFIVAGSFTH